MVKHLQRAPEPSPASRGRAIRAEHGLLDWHRLRTLLANRSLVPFPCELRFDAGPLLPGEFAHPAPKGLRPDEGFVIYLHPALEQDVAELPYAVLQQLALIEYGNVIGPEEAEAFGCQALGVSADNYYTTLCRLAERVGGDELS